MKRINNKLAKRGPNLAPLHLLFVLMFFLYACQSQVLVQPTTPSLSNNMFNSLATPSKALPSNQLDLTKLQSDYRPTPVFKPKKGPHGTITSSGPITTNASGQQTKSLTFNIDYSALNRDPSSKGFRTQAIRCQNIGKVKIFVRGIAIGAPIYADGFDGNNNVNPGADGCSFSATVSNVPFGKARIAVVEGYLGDGTTLVPGSELKAVFDMSADPTNVEITYKSTLNGIVVENIINNPDPFTASHMSLPDLSTLVNTITGTGGTFPHYTYTYHPTWADDAQLTTDLLGNGGNSGALTAGDYDNMIPGDVTGTLAGLVSTDTAIIQVTDPASPISLNNGNGAFSFTDNVTPGTWDVIATAQGGTTYTVSGTPTVSPVASGGDAAGTITFTPATPTITGIWAPPSVIGIVGDVVVIDGTNFHDKADGNVVKFGATTVPVGDVVPGDNGTLRVKVPTGAFGDLNITVQVGSEISGNQAFSVTPHISSLSATTFPTGASIQINGSGFDPMPGNNTVQFNGGTGTVTAASNTQLTVTVPAGAVIGGVTVQAGSNVSDAYFYNIGVDNPPNISSLTPSKNPVLGLGYPVQLVVAATDDLTTLVAGSYAWTCQANCGDGNFNQTNDTTVIYTVPTTAQGGDTTIRVAVDDGVNAPVTQDINITVTNGNATVNVDGTTAEPLATSSLFIAEGEIGMYQVIHGSGFSPNNASNTVKFGAVTVASGDTVVLSPNDIRAKIPAGIFGDVNVTVDVDSVTSNAQTFKVLPKITNVTPASGDPGVATAITIDGSGFQVGITATVGGQNCTGLVRVNDTQLTCNTDNTLALGKHDVVVTNPDTKFFTAPDVFEVQTAAPPQAPTTNIPGAAGSVVRIADDPNNNNVIYAGTLGQAVYKSTDNGDTWTRVGSSTLKAIDVVVKPGDSTTIHSAWDGGIGDGHLISTDSGGSFNVSNSGITANPKAMVCTALEPGNPNVIYDCNLNEGVWKSTDGGANWNASNTGITTESPKHIVVDHTTTSTIYMGANTSGMWKSTDSGGSWSQINTGLPGSTSVRRIAQDPGNANLLYIATNNGVYKTTDGGSNWIAQNTGITETDLRDLAMDPSNASIMYVGSIANSGGFYKTTDGGANWNSVPQGALPNLQVRAIGIESVTGRIFIGLLGGGVYYIP